MSGVEALRAVAHALLREPLRPTAADELYALLATGALSDRSSSPSALSPARAADCTRDLRRTAVFLRGLHDAIRQFDGVVEVLYAGTGPLAPLALPLMALLGNVRFTLVDIHAESVEHLRSLIARFGFTHLVRELAVADATSFIPTVQPRVAVTETMRRSLAVEPQTAITRQLARVLRPDGILLPEQITLSLEVAEDVTEWLNGGDLPPRRQVATILALTRHSDGFPAVHATIPEGIALLTTAVDVYGEHRLRDLDSGLTTPEILWDLRPGEEVELRYRENPFGLERSIAHRCASVPATRCTSADRARPT